MTDHIGSVRDLVSYDANDDEITLEAHIKYNAFGEIISETDADDNAVTDNDHIFGFTGRERDKESDLYYYRNRYYDPTTGRFLTADPVEDDLENTYRYVNNDPVNNIDPSGLMADSVGHHLVIQSSWDGKNGHSMASKAAITVWDNIRIHNDSYNTHNMKTLNGVSHHDYNQEVKKILNKWLTANGKNLATLTADDAMAFANHLTKHRSKTIRKFLKGVKVEAHYSKIAANISPAAKAALDAAFIELAANQNALNDLGPKRAKIKAKVQKAETLEEKKKIVGGKRNQGTLEKFKKARRNANAAKAKINQIISGKPSVVKPLKTMGRVGGKLFVVMDVLNMAKILRDGEETAQFEKAVFVDKDGSKYTARSGGWAWKSKTYLTKSIKGGFSYETTSYYLGYDSPSISYFSGLQKGATKSISNSQYNGLKNLYHELYGKFKPYGPLWGAFNQGTGSFTPGTRRKTIEYFKTDNFGRIWWGYYDENGLNMKPKPEYWGRPERGPGEPIPHT